MGMPVQIVRNEVPQGLQQSVATGIFSAIGNRAGLWEVDITSELTANAWDVEVFGPNDFHWARRFSGEDRVRVVKAVEDDHALPVRRALGSLRRRRRPQNLAQRRLRTRPVRTRTAAHGSS